MDPGPGAAVAFAGCVLSACGSTDPLYGNWAPVASEGCTATGNWTVIDSKGFGVVVANRPMPIGKVVGVERPEPGYADLVVRELLSDAQGRQTTAAQTVRYRFEMQNADRAQQEGVAPVDARVMAIMDMKRCK